MSSSLNLFSKGLQSLISLTFLFNYFSSLCHSSGLRPSLLSLQVALFWLTECPGFFTPGLRLRRWASDVPPVGSTWWRNKCLGRKLSLWPLGFSNAVDKVICAVQHRSMLWDVQVMKGCEVRRPTCSFGEEFRVESSVSWQAWGGRFDLVRNTAGYLHS